VDATRELLVSGMGSVDAIDVGGCTALHLCSSSRVASVLLEHGADPHARNRAMRTPREHHAFLGVADVDISAVLEEAETSSSPPRVRLLGWRSILLAAVLSVLMTRYLTMAVEGQLPRRIL
jgi:hypothetical protein